ncbi:MAG: hypothetical protein QM758_07960 [Armatimonas sp.]
MYKAKGLAGRTLEAVRKYARILVVTAADTEHQTVAGWLSEHPLPFHLSDSGEPVIGSVSGPSAYFASVEGYVVAHLPLIDLHNNSERGITLRMNQYIADFCHQFPEVRVILMPGICFGLHPRPEIVEGFRKRGITFVEQASGTQKLGDVILASHVVDVLTGEQGNLQNSLTPELQRIITNRNHEAEPGYGIEVGEMLNVPAVLNDPTLRNTYYQTYPQARGGEMELLYLDSFRRYVTDAVDREQVYVFLAKSICDWAAGKARWGEEGRDEHEKERLLASQNSVDFFRRLFTYEAKNVFAAIKGVDEYKNIRLDPERKALQVATYERGDPEEEIRRWQGIRNDASLPEKLRVSYWAKRLTEASVPLSLLLIAGPGGRGKTFYAKQVRLSIANHEDSERKGRHLWVDCSSSSPTAEFLILAFSKLVPEDTRASFYDAALEKLTATTGQNAAVFTRNEVHDTELTTYIKYTLFGTDEAQIPDNRDIYIYFDDFHLYVDELAMSGPLRQLLVSFCGEHSEGRNTGRVRIIATSRDAALGNLVRSLSAGIVVDEVSDGSAALPLFGTDTQRAYLEKRGGIIGYLQEGDLKPFLELVSGDPLSLDGIEDVFQRAREGDATQRESLENLKAGLQQLLARYRQGELPIGDTPTAIDERIKAVRQVIFSTVLENWPPLTQAALEVLSVANFVNRKSTDLQYDPFEWPQETTPAAALVSQMLSAYVAQGLKTRPHLSAIWNAGIAISPTTTARAIEELRHRGVLGEKGFLLADDRLDDYIYEERLDISARCLLHACVATALTEPGQIFHALWHRFHAADKDSLSPVFDDLLQHWDLFLSKNRLAALKTLTTYFRIRLWNPQADAATGQPFRWYLNQGKMAEILYFGFSLSSTVSAPAELGIPEQDLWELFSSALTYLECYESEDYLEEENRSLYPYVVDTMAQCQLLRSIFIFEGEAPEEHGITDAGRPLAMSPRPNLWLARQTGEIVARFAQVHGNADGDNPPLTAITRYFQGCYYNGGKLLTEAIQAFHESAGIFERYKTRLYSTPQYHSKTEQAQREITLRFNLDYLDLANSWSRSRFLLSGPDSGLGLTEAETIPLERFKELVDASEKDCGRSIEFMYCLVDLCYYYLAKNDLAAMTRYLNKAYTLSDATLNLPTLMRLRKDNLVELVKRDMVENYSLKRAVDSWAEGYIDALETACYFYRTPMTEATVAVAKEAFLCCAMTFDDEHFGYTRDEGFMRANSVLVELCANKDIAARREVLGRVEAVLTEHKAIDEPIATDTLRYLKVLFGVYSEDESEEIVQSVAETRVRFPGHAAIPITDDAWRPPILLRGALMMVPEHRSPAPVELGITEWRESEFDA